MAQLTVHINGKAYLLGCEDGEEPRLQSLAALVDEKVRTIGHGGAALGETRVLLMGALMLADDALGARERLAASDAEAERLRAELDKADARAVALLESAAKKIETLAAR